MPPIDCEDQELLDGFLAETTELLEKLDDDLINLEKSSDDAELMKAAKLREHERAVGRRGAERRDHGARTRAPPGRDQRLFDRVAVAALLHVARQENDAAVHAVADDHRAEKGRVGIE